MPLPSPINNNVLIELINPHGEITGSDDNATEGIIRDWSLSRYHLTASSGFLLDGDVVGAGSTQEWLQKLVDNKSIVRWEEFANEGQEFEQDGKKYALVPWWRLLSARKGDK